MARPKKNNTESTKTTTDPLALLEALSLADIREQIVTIENEMEEFCSVRRNRIAGLRVLEKAADVRQNGKPVRQLRKPRATRETKPAAAESPKSEPKPGTLRARIREYVEAQGSARVKTMEKDLGAHYQSIYGVLRDGDFVKNPDGTYSNKSF